MKLLDTIKRIFNEYQNKSEENMEILKENLLNIFRGVDDGVFNDKDSFEISVTVDRDYESRLIKRYTLLLSTMC